MDISILPWVAALIHLTAFGLYTKVTVRKTAKPVATSWGMWAFAATLNAITFRAMTDTLSALQFIAGSVGCIVVFIALVFLGELRRLSGKEWAVITVGILAFVMWRLTTAAVANGILVASVIYSFWPTVASVRKDPASDWWVPWALWSLSTSLTLSYKLLTAGITFALVMPLALVLGHGITCFYLLKGRGR